MMQTTNRSTILTPVLSTAIFILAILGSGCGDAGPTTPASLPTDQGAVERPGPSASTGASMSSTSPLSWYAVASASVAPSKAVVLQGSRYKVSLPIGAVSSTTTVSIWEYSPASVDFRIDPAGLVTAKAFELTVNYSGTVMDPSSPFYLGAPVLLGYNPVTQAWEEILGKTARRTVLFTANPRMFTRFTMVPRPSGGLDELLRYLPPGDGTADW